MPEELMPHMFCSVILPTWNSLATLPASIESVLMQSLPVNELVIVNDGSTDATREWLDTLPAQHGTTQIRIIHQKNQGLACARNVGIAHTSGELIAFIDSDDAWEPLKHEHQCRVMADDPELMLLGCTSSILSHPSDKEVIPIAETALLLRNWLIPSGVILRRKVLDEVGMFSESLTHCEDYELWMRIVHHHRCALLNRRLLNYGQGKPGFGASGLSSNLPAMRIGEIRTLKTWRQIAKPWTGLYLAARLLAELRHQRRVLLTWYRYRRVNHL